jgi:hypothetical protein
MTLPNRWLRELPADSTERHLLTAGKAARAPKGNVERGWQTFSATLAAASATSVVTAKAVATTAVAPHSTAAASAASATVTTKATLGALGLSLGTKSLAIGFAIGMGVIGTRKAVSQLSHRDSASPSTSIVSRPAAIVTPSPPHATSILPSFDERPPEPFEPKTLPVTAAAAATNHVTAPTVDLELRATSLAEQARELAQIKRLIDAGTIEEAVHRLEASFVRDVHTTLAEERDALYIQALERAQRTAQAKNLAKRFFVRYPSSPHAETMRGLIATE